MLSNIFAFKFYFKKIQCNSFWVAGIGMEDSERNVQLHKEAAQRGG